MGSVTVKDHLIAMYEYAYQRLWGRLEGLTDEEYKWQPVPGCWTAGDWANLVDETPPFTDISWRLTHIIDSMVEPRMARWLGVEEVPHDVQSVSPTAAGALDNLAKAYANLQAHLKLTDDALLAEELGPMGGPYADKTRGDWACTSWTSSSTTRPRWG